MPSSNKNYDLPELYDQLIGKQIQKRIDENPEPFGAFGVLSGYYTKCGMIQARVRPLINDPVLLLFAADQGIVKKLAPHVFKKRSTARMVLNYLHGDTPEYLIYKEDSFKFRLIDCGVDHQFEKEISYWLHHNNKLISAKINELSADFRDYPALSTADCQAAIDLGAQLVKREHYRKSSFIALGSISEGVTLSNLALTAAFFDCDPKILVEERDGALYQPIRDDISIADIKKALNRHPKSHDAKTILSFYGGTQTAALVGAIVEAALKRIPVLLCDETSLVAAACASRLLPGSEKCLILGDKPKHLFAKKIMRSLSLRPVHHFQAGDRPFFVANQSLPLMKDTFKYWSGLNP